MSSFNTTDDLDFENRVETQDRVSAEIAADFANRFLMHRHRGVINCDSDFVIFANDGYSSDQRSRIEAAEVWGKLRHFDAEAGVSRNGCTWAIVLTDHNRQLFDEEELDHLVWDTWMDVCDRYGPRPVEACNGTTPSNPEGVCSDDAGWELV